MATLDIFNDDAFSLTSLTAAVNELPVGPTQINQSGLFEEDGITTTTMIIESQKGLLSLVEPSPRGGPGETIKKDQRNERAFVSIHLERDDAIMADEVQNLRAFGQENQVETVQNRIVQRVARHIRDFDMTDEHMRCGAIKGIVLDKNGNTLVDSYNAFGITAPDPINFALTTESTKVRQKCQYVKNKVEDALDGTPYSRIDVLCGRNFFEELIEHKNVRETYLNTVQASELRGDVDDVFTFGGLTFKKYKFGTSAKVAAATGGGFIGDDVARVVPVGVPEMFISRYSPADYIETVNTVGLPRYMKQMIMPNGKGVQLEVQSNPFHICTRPGALFELTKAGS